MTVEEYKEILKDVLNNGTEYECCDADASCWCQREGRYVTGCSKDRTQCKYSNEDCDISVWRDFNITDGFIESYKFRKKVPKTWIQNYIDGLDVRLSSRSAVEQEICKAIVAMSIIKFYEELLKRAQNKDSKKEAIGEYISCELELLAKEMGLRP